jgi:hypothetical protein
MDRRRRWAAVKAAVAAFLLLSTASHGAAREGTSIWITGFSYLETISFPSLVESVVEVKDSAFL